MLFNNVARKMKKKARNEGLKTSDNTVIISRSRKLFRCLLSKDYSKNELFNVHSKSITTI